MPKQPTSINDDAPATPAPPARPPAADKRAVTALKFNADQMSPAQKRFNLLLKQTETLALKMEGTRNLVDLHRTVCVRTLAPLEKERKDNIGQMVRWLDQRLQVVKGLSAKQKDIAREILCHLAAILAAEGDEAMQALHDAHSDQSLEDLEKADIADMQSLMEDVFGHKLGDDDAPFDNLGDLMRANMARLQAEAKAAQDNKAQHQAKRKKTATQLKTEVQAQDADGALRTIYRQLVSALHPDREPDPAEQARKTALMKDANTAYERRDLLALLHLQLQADLVDGAHIASMAKSKLTALTTLLKERVAVLQRELFNMEAQARAEFGMTRHAPLSSAALKKQLVESELNLRTEIALMQQDLKLVQDDTRFKRWLKEQKAAQDDFDPMGFF
jgi:hypothetical protein